jgi:hypothetical protein
VFIENISKELDEKKKEYVLRINEINQLLETINDVNFNQAVYEVQIKKQPDYSDGTNLTIIKKGSLEEIIKYAESDFKKINTLFKAKPYYKVYIFLKKNKKIFKVEVSKNCFENFCNLNIKSIK